MGWFLRRVKADAEALIAEELGRVRQAVTEEIQGLRREARLIAERSEAAVSRMLELEGKIAALEATSHRVSYVPVDAMKGLKAEDVERMNDVPERVRDTLKEIVDLQERLQGFQDLENFEETL